MSDPTRRARARRLPVLSDPPFLCSTCRHGSVMVQKLQPWLLDQEAWKDRGPGWFWRSTCTSPKVSPWRFSVFCHPVVECDAYRARKLLTTEDVARKRAAKRKKRRTGRTKGA